jgi:hypothetical protein
MSRGSRRNRIRTTVFRARDFSQPDLGPGHRPHLTTKRISQQLMAEADAEKRAAEVLDPGPDRVLLGSQPGMGIFLPDIHRPAHHGEKIEAVEIGDNLTRIKFDSNELMPLGGPQFAEDAGMLDVEMLEDQYAHGRALRAWVRQERGFSFLGS